MRTFISILCLLCLSACKKQEYTSLYQENLKGNVHSVILTELEDGYEYKTQYYYSPQGYLIRETFIWNSLVPDCNEAEMPFTSYWENGMIQRKRVFYNTPVLTFTIHKNKAIARDDEVEDNNETYIYDNNGLLKTHMGPVLTITYHYKDGRLIRQEIESRIENGKWGYNWECHYEYNNDGDVIKETCPMRSKIYKYDAYDDMGNWTARTVLVSINEEQTEYSPSLETREITYYGKEKER